MEKTQSELMEAYHAHFETHDGYQYIVFEQPPDQTLSNYYYFHNINNTNSCLDCIYTVVTDDTVFDLMNYTKTIDTKTTVNGVYGVSDINGRYWFPFSFTPTFTGALHDYYTKFAASMIYHGNIPSVNVYSNQYYISSTNTYIWILQHWNEYYPVDEDQCYESIYKDVAGHASIATPETAYIPIKILAPVDYFKHGIPCRLMPQFKQTTSIKLPPGIYTYSEFKEVLSTVEWPTGYTYDSNTSTLSTSCAPEYTFAIETSLLNIQPTFGVSLQISDPLAIRKAIAVEDNHHAYIDYPENSVLITRNGVPTSITHSSNQVVMQSNEKFIELFQSENIPLTVYNLLPDVNIPANNSYKHVKMQGYLRNMDITNPQTVSINDTTYTVGVSINICKTFTQPLVISNNKNVLLSCRVSYVDPV